MSAKTHPPASHLTVAILAGGLGTRLRSVMADRPKVLAPVGGRPFLAWWLDALDAQGFREIVLCTGYRAEQVRDAFGPQHGHLTLRYSMERQPLGTGGALRQAVPLIQSDSFLALNGDSFCEVSLPAFVADHLERGARASLVLTPVNDTSRFGSVDLKPNGRVERFREKAGKSAPGWINAGIYAFSRDLFTAWPEKQALSLERDLLPNWVAQGIRGFRCPGKFIDIGTPESLAQAEDFFRSARLAAA